MSAAPSVFVFRRIRTRLAAGFGLVLCIALIMGAAAVWWLERLEEQNQYLSHNAQGLALAQKWASGVRTNLDRSMTATRLEATVADDSTLQAKLTPLKTQLTQEMAESASESSALQEKLAKFDTDMPLHDLVQNVVSRRQHFVKLRGEIRDDLQMGDGAHRIDTELVGAANTMIDALDRLRDYLQHRNDEATQVIATEIKNSQTAIVLLCLAALTVGGVVSAFITRVLVAPVRYSAHAANELAAGNLAVNIEVRGHDETAQLLKSLNDMREAFVAVVTRVRSNAEGLVQASSNLSLGNVSLTERTNLETNALDSTAQAINDLGVTAAQNAENAAQVHNLTQSATKIAQRAGYEVNRVISTMNDINIASNKIGDIVSVIDGIAFQTNLLALNAAVEAARAGEFGRGFAVVASEVRSLAGRSADAAKSIRSLAGANINSAAQGSEVVNRAGDTMQEVVSSFDQVHQLMANITQASQEQNQGVQDVRTAMEHMSQAVAANAEMIQVNSDSASLVAQQADELVQAVSIFQLGDQRPLSQHAMTTPTLITAAEEGEQPPSDLAISAA